MKQFTEKQKKSWFKKGHKLSAESIEKMRKSKTKYTPEERMQREKNRAKDPDRIAWTKNYYNTPIRRYAIYERSAKTKNIDFALSFEEFMSYWQTPCSYCDSPIDTIGIDRVNSKFGYTIDNIVPCCKICNYMKRDLAQDEFLVQCKKIINFNK
jgi:hypothetical protein